MIFTRPALQSYLMVMIAVSATSVALAGPPAGFTELFNGQDLSGWHGVMDAGKPPAEPRDEAAIAKAQDDANASMHQHWSVADGVIAFDGGGESIATDKDYADFELYVDWKILPGGDSGLYLRGCPQVQIWDPDHPASIELGADKGSGGLWNNKQHERFPDARADRPIGQWNTFHITMIGDRVTVELNDKLVVDTVVMENYWDRDTAIADQGPIFLQNHGNELWFRNLYIRELSQGND